MRLLNFEVGNAYTAEHKIRGSIQYRSTILREDVTAILNASRKRGRYKYLGTFSLHHYQSNHKYLEKHSIVSLFLYYFIMIERSKTKS